VGILSGLAWAAGEGCKLMLSLPCDVPIVPQGMLTELIGASAGGRVAYICANGSVEPLCAAWPVGFHTNLRTMLESGRHPAVRSVQESAGARAVTYSGADAFQNINTADDLAALEAALGDDQPSFGAER
jgi:molybdopterin-guanine dinucleotide biosynthesis protein A